MPRSLVGSQVSRSGRAGVHAGRSRGRSPRAGATRSGATGRAASRTASASASRSSVDGPWSAGSRASRSTSQPRGADSRSLCVVAQVVGVRLGVGGQRAEDRRLVGVDVGQRRDRGSTAGRARTAAGRTHVADGTSERATARIRLAAWIKRVRRAGRDVRGIRDRRGRGMRGPAVTPTVPGRPERPPPASASTTSRSASSPRSTSRWQDRLGLVEYAVEDTPQIPDDWTSATVPLSSLVRGSGATPTRLVLFRRPIEHRCETRARSRGAAADRRRRAGRGAPRHRRRGGRPALRRRAVAGPTAGPVAPAAPGRCAAGPSAAAPMRPPARWSRRRRPPTCAPAATLS